MNTIRQLKTFLMLFYTGRNPAFLCRHEAKKIFLIAPPGFFAYDGYYCFSCLMTLLTNKTDLVWDVRKTCRMCHNQKYSASISLLPSWLLKSTYIIHVECLLAFVDLIGIDSLETIVALTE